MPDAGWGTVKQAFLDACEMDARERGRYLDTLEEEVRRGVESLLRQDPKDFLEKPASSYAVEYMRDEPVPEHVGAYRIVRELGQGGMGRVFLAERADGQFEKRAAIKILHSCVEGSDLRSRFLQERQLLANLDHPNIVRVIDGNVTPDGRPYLVEDYVEGKPITSYAAAHGLGRRECIRLGVQAASALAYAHRLGIVHGDLKPANILVTEDGNLKLIDFGIARIGGQGGDGLRYSTPGYASPEQESGEPMGTPSDVYSLAAVLVEVLRISPGRGSGDKVLRRALAKDPEQRPTAAEFQTKLQRAVKPRLWWAVASGMALVLAVLGFAVMRRAPVTGIGAVRSVPIAAEESLELEPVLSPDGKDAVYVWNEGEGRGFHLYRKPVAGGAPQRLTSAKERDAFPQYSPDGKEIVFSRSSKDVVRIIRLDLRSGQETVVHTIESRLEARQRSVRRAVWMADGRHLAIVQRQSPAGPYAIFQVTADGGQWKQLTLPMGMSGGDEQAAASPDGRYLAFVRFSTGVASDLYVLPLHGSEPRRITNQGVPIYGICWSPDSRHLYFGARIRSALYSIYRVAVTGEPVVERVPGIEGNATWPSVATYGGRARIAYLRDQETVNARAWQRPFVAGKPVNLCASTLFDGGVNVSPDGARVVFNSTRSGTQQIWICDTATGKAEMISDPTHLRADSARWSPDGERIAYTVTEGDSTDIAFSEWKSRRFRTIRLAESREGKPSFSRDGKWLYFRSNRDGSDRIWKMTVDGNASEAKPLTGPYGYEAIESMDGRWVYYTKDRSHPGLFRIPAGGGEEEQVADGVREGWWDLAADGAYWIAGGWPFIVETLPWNTRQPLRVATLPAGGGIWSGFSVSANGRTLFWTQSSNHSSDIMLLDGL